MVPIVEARGPGRWLLLLAPPSPARVELLAALQGADLTVDVAADAEEARARTAGRALPLSVVLDVQAGRPCAWRFLEWVRLQARFDRVPVVLLGAGDAPSTSLAAPCAALPRGAAPSDVRAAIVDLGERARPVLIVDDDPDYADAAARLLEGAGYLVEVVGSGAAAIDFLEREEAAAVLLDRGMPAPDGPQVFAWIRAQRRLARLPVVFVSGERPPSRVHQLNYHRTFWVTKPVDPAALLEVVRVHVGAGLARAEAALTARAAR